MLTTILPSPVSGEIWAPASKSSMQRACAAALLRVGETIIHHPGHSNDDKAALGVIRDLGADWSPSDNGSLLVRSRGMKGETGFAGAEAVQVSPGTGMGQVNSSVGPLQVNCGESGLGIRMFAPIIALSGRAIRVVGEGSLLSRPMDFFDEIFPQLGIRVLSNKGRLPLEIQGPLQPRTITIDGSLSSQFLTGLLLSYAAAGAKGVSIRVENLKSKPYIDLTLAVMKHFGWEVENINYEEFYFDGARVSAGTALSANPTDPSATPLEYTVEGDWSGGAFLLVAGAIAGPLTVKGLDTESTQADKAILSAIRDSGALLQIDKNEIVVGPAEAKAIASGEAGSSAAAKPLLKAFRFDATDCPDLFPPLVALAAYCEGTTVVRGVDRLAHKESNRGLTLQEEFGKLGVAIELDGDEMRIRGGKPVRGATVHSHHDHRIAMACGVAALRGEGPVTIEVADAINKSYPDFYRDLQQGGADLEITETIHL